MITHLSDSSAVSEISDSQFKHLRLWKATTLAHLDGSARNPEAVYVGVDPGAVHMGLAVVWHTAHSKVWAEVYELEFDNLKDHVGQANLVYAMTRLVLKMSAQRAPRFTSDIYATIEGPSYGDSHGQVLLAEARIAAVFAIQDEYTRSIVGIVAPKSIRLGVFGSGTITEKIWKDQLSLKNGAAALAAALSRL